MWRNGVRLTIPNPHGGDLDWSLVKRILVQAGLDADEWEKLCQEAASSQSRVPHPPFYLGKLPTRPIASPVLA
jgi:hypothetical protein